MEEWEKTKCFLCGSYEAKKLMVSRNLRVICPTCNFYYLTSGVQKFRLDENNNLICENRKTKIKNLLTEKQKQYLRNHVQKNHDPSGAEPVKINVELLDNLCEKMSLF